MRNLSLAWMRAALPYGCSSQQNGGSASKDSWTGGARDFSGLGVEFTAPMDLESRSGTATSMVWVSAKNDEGLTVHYDASLTPDSLSAALPDTVSLEDGAKVNATGAVTPLVLKQVNGLQRAYSADLGGGRKAYSHLAVLTRQTQDNEAFGGVRILGSTFISNVETVKQRVLAVAASLKFSGMAPDIVGRRYLAVGEWSFAGPSGSASGNADIGRELLWLCTGRFAYKQTGFVGGTVISADEGQLKIGTWDVYSGVGQPLLSIKLDGDQVPKLYPVSVQADGDTFTWSGKSFLRTDRGCELGLPTKLWAE